MFVLLKRSQEEKKKRGLRKKKRKGQTDLTRLVQTTETPARALPHQMKQTSFFCGVMYDPTWCSLSLSAVKYDNDNEIQKRNSTRRGSDKKENKNGRKRRDLVKKVESPKKKKYIYIYNNSNDEEEGTCRLKTTDDVSTTFWLRCVSYQQHVRLYVRELHTHAHIYTERKRSGSRKRKE